MMLVIWVLRTSSAASAPSAVDLSQKLPKSPVRSAGLPKPSKCRPILESFYISAPVAARYFILKQGFAVSIVPMQTNTVHPNKPNSQISQQKLA